MKRTGKMDVKTIATGMSNAMSNDLQPPHENNQYRWTEILFRALSNRVAKRWRFVSFRGLKEREFCGIVDVLAICKDTAKSDHEILRMGGLFEIILVQMKVARPGCPKHPT